MSVSVTEDATTPRFPGADDTYKVPFECEQGQYAVLLHFAEDADRGKPQAGQMIVDV